MCTLYNGWSEVKNLLQKIASTRECSNATTSIYYFRDKRVVFARNRKFANLIQYKMQYLPCNRALLAQETLRTTSATLAGTTHVE